MKIQGRFWSKVRKTETCWIWNAFKNKGGYGHFWVNGQNVYAHRFSYEIVNGKILSGMSVDHLCRTRCCVNPGHMQIVTLTENSWRNKTSQMNVKKTHCKRGHKFNEENTYLPPNKNERICRECKRLSGIKQKTCK